MNFDLNNKKIGGIIQARTGSSRLPNKIFASIINKPLIWHIYNRLTFSKFLQEIIIATSVNPADDKIQNWAIENNIKYYRGSELDVLSRFYETAKQFNLDYIVRITADDPFKDPILIDKGIELILENKLNFVCNNNPPTFPEGLDVEVFDFQSLKLANSLSNSQFEREHVTQYFYRNPTAFKTLNFSSIENNSHLRWTIDRLNDLQMATFVYEKLYSEKKVFLYSDILDLITHYPEINNMNFNNERSEMYKKK